MRTREAAPTPTPADDPRTDDLRAEIVRLAPWHLDVEVVPGLSTGVFRDEPRKYPKEFGAVSFLDARPAFHALVKRIYPGGLEGRRVLDCACNCGGYLFWAKELGAGDSLGFDVRDHWIDQARFLARSRATASDGIRFAVSDLYDLPALDAGEFDVTIFKGIFYHLPDPITGLKLAAERTRELLLLNTATRSGVPDGFLAVEREDVAALMSGVYGLNWLPTGPEVLRRILAWLGFPATRVTFSTEDSRGLQAQGLGRIELLAARDERVFRHYDAR